MKKKTLSVVLLIFLYLLSGCRGRTEPPSQAETLFQNSISAESAATVPPSTLPASTEATVPAAASVPVTETASETASAEPADAFRFDLVPPYAGAPYAVIHDNVPFFTDLPSQSFETYAPLDALGRCGPAFACIGRDLMPTEERGPIGMVRPTGWHTVKYEFVDGKYLYNRCHLIGFQLTGENANERNLITGTRYLNIEGMLPFENMTADYIKETGGHVLYRVTPVFEGRDLLCRGVLMEGISTEDQGAGLQFCVFAYNVQPGAEISYADGTSTALETPAATVVPPSSETSSGQADYVLNKNTKKFHIPGCSSVDSMKEQNKIFYTGSREELIAEGYAPCKRCNP